MSRFYQYELTTFDGTPALTREQAIEVAKAWSELCGEEVRPRTFVEARWSARDGDTHLDWFVEASPTVQLAAGVDSAEDDVRRYIEAVWRAAGCFVDDLTATVVFIEDAPTEGVYLDEDAYKAMLDREDPSRVPRCPSCGGERRQCETGGPGCWHCDTCDDAGRENVSPPGAP